MITRKSFLKGVAATGAATLAAGATAAMAEEAWDEEYDIIIVGSGVGLAAACEAYLQDPAARIVVLEREDIVGGLWKFAGGHVLVGCTPQQEANGIEDSPELWYRDELYAQSYRGIPEILQTFVTRGLEFVDWLDQFDISLTQTPSFEYSTGCMSVNRSHLTGPGVDPRGNKATGTGCGMTWTLAWNQFLEDNGVPVLCNHEMKEIVREENGPVTGVVVETPEGIKRFKATKAVILCTGTWTDNYRMFSAWDRRVVGPDCFGDGGTPCDGTLFVNSDGNGHIAACKVGAGFSDMSYSAYYYIFFGARSYWGCEPYGLEAKNIQGGQGVARSAAFYNHVMIVKGEDAARYVNESLGTDVSYGSVAESTDRCEYTRKFLELENIEHPRNVWAVADADIAADLAWDLDALNNPDPKRGSMFDPDCIAIADTLEELAEKMGMDPAQLVASVDRYNGFVDNGLDEDFGKADLAFKIQTPPFYGLKASLIRHTQRNGIRVNTKAQVIEQADQINRYEAVSAGNFVRIDDEAIIPHLYACGELGDIMGWRRCHGSLLGYATFARIAAENAVVEEPVA